MTSSNPRRLKKPLVAATMRSCGEVPVDFLAHGPDSYQQPRIDALDLLTGPRWAIAFGVSRGADPARRSGQARRNITIHHRAALFAHAAEPGVTDDANDLGPLLPPIGSSFGK